MPAYSIEFIYSHRIGSSALNQLLSLVRTPRTPNGQGQLQFPTIDLKLAKSKELLTRSSLLIEPLLSIVCVSDQLFRLEPQSNLSHSCLRSITPVNNIPGYLDAEIPSNGSRF
jgi:hypothetical protein